MKFRCRVIAAAILSIAIVIAYITWSLFHGTPTLDGDNMGKSRVDDAVPRPPDLPNDRKTLKLTQMPETSIKLPIDELHQTVDATIEGSSADIRTIDILESIDKQLAEKRQQILVAAKRTSTARTPHPSVEEMARGLPLKVIVVPHSHSDPGWHKTVDGYFMDQTKPTLDNMLEKLTEYPQMTFVWAESVFLSMWWQDLEPEKRDAVRRLIRRGQLEIVGGGWVVPDEANPHYFSLVDQMIEGHQWLKENVGVVPANTWSLDPFGYSAVLSYLQRRAGFNHSVILRVHADVKEHLEKRKALEFIWRPSWKIADGNGDDNNTADVLTLMMPYMLYNIKHSCGPDPSVCIQFDFRKIRGEMSEARATFVTPANVDRLARLLLGQYQRKADLFRHNVVLVPLGDDFRFDRAVEWDQQFKNYMQLFNHMNAKSAWNVEARFGTVADYFREAEAAMARLRAAGDGRSGRFPSLSGDFFPYTDREDEFWTGYFSTRPFAKGTSRNLEVFLRTAEIFNTLAISQSAADAGSHYDAGKNVEKLVTARRNLALFQHHDGITGTSRVWVSDDYLERLKSGIFLTRGVIGSAAGFLLHDRNSASSASTNLLRPAVKVLEPLSVRSVAPNHHVVHIHEGKSARLHVVNNVAHHRHELIQVVVNNKYVTVTDHLGKPVLSQIEPVPTDLATTEKMKPDNPQNVDSSSEQGDIYTLSFIADLPALGISAYNITTTSITAVDRSKAAKITAHKTLKSLYAHDLIVDGRYIRAGFSRQTGLLKSVTIKSSNHSVDVNLKFLLYESKRSGAYIFSPSGPAAAFGGKRLSTMRIAEGPVFTEVRLVRTSVVHAARIVHCDCPLATSVELTNVVDMTDLDDTELIMRVDSSLLSDDVFYTDQNGFVTVRRRRFASFPREANYYPATAAVYIQDARTRLSVLMSSPFGVSSQVEGSVEIMLDRRLRYDDNRGLGEGVLDNQPVFSRFYLLVEPRSTEPGHGAVKSTDESPNEGFSLPSLLASVLIDRLRNEPILLMSAGDDVPQVVPMRVPFSCDVILVNLRSLWKNQTSSSSDDSSQSAAMILHRIGYESRYDFGGARQILECRPQFADPIPAEIFHDAPIRRLSEMTLSLLYQKSIRSAEQELNLKPMQLHTYRVVF